MSFRFFFLLSIILLNICCQTEKGANNDLPEIFSNGARVDYIVEGNGDTVLLFVHGWCINKSYWVEQVDFFKTRYKVIALDLPGHGLSGKTRDDWTIEGFGSDLVTVIDVLDLNNVVLVGHSMGGNIILEAAVKRPDQIIGFVGVDNFKDAGAAYTEEQSQSINEFMISIRQDYETVARGFAEGMLFAESTGSDIVTKVTDDILNTPPEVSIEILESLLRVNNKERELMKELHLKVNLINSDIPPTNELQLRKYCNYDYGLYSIGSTGHYPMMEEPGRFNSILQEILKKLN